MLNAASTRNRSPFTATQRQELEHQALIFKYMVAGVPIPPELLYSIKRSLEYSMSTSGLFPHHRQPAGWGCFQVGFGRKADPEPGRCRRTDGKKWRCSKEAYPDSKYCERHMHRGRNRSRKPVELASSATTAAAATATTNDSTSSINIINSNSTNNSLSSSSYTFPPHPHQNPSHSTYLNPFLYSSSSNKPPGCAATPQNSTTSSLFSDPGSSLHPDNDYRYIHEMRSLDERTLFPEASGSVRSLQNPYQELTMTPYKGYSELGFQRFADTAEHHQEQQQQHCFVLGTDFKSSAAAATRRPVKWGKEAETQKPLHHFFGEWQPKNTDSWLDLSSNSRPAHR